MPRPMGGPGLLPHEQFGQSTRGILLRHKAMALVVLDHSRNERAQHRGRLGQFRRHSFGDRQGQNPVSQTL